MKAWNDLVDNPDIDLFWTDNSDWYLDRGIKIERFHADGRIEIRSVMSNGEKFRKLTPIQMDYFVNVGWSAGCHRACIDEFKARVERINKRLRSNLPEIRKQKQRLDRDGYMKRIFTWSTALDQELKNSHNK